MTDAQLMPRHEVQTIDASAAIAEIHAQMLSPLVNTVVPVHNLDGSIDESSPGIERFHWVDGPSDRPYWTNEPSDEHNRPRVHIAPGGFATVRFPAQGPHPQDDVEGSEQEPYDSSEEFARFLNQPVHVDNGPAAALVDQAAPHSNREAEASRWARPARFQDHLRLVKAVAERYEVVYCDRRDPPTAWEASRKIATLLSTWIVGTFDGTITTHFDLGGHQSIRDLLADSAQFHRVVMQAAANFHRNVLPAALVIQQKVQANIARRTMQTLYEAYRAHVQGNGSAPLLRQISDSGYDPNNLRCPDRVPGCFCGDESEERAAARIIQNAWRIHLLGPFEAHHVRRKTSRQSCATSSRSGTTGAR